MRTKMNISNTSLYIKFKIWFENSFLENVLVWSIGTWSLHTIKLGIIYSGYSWLNFLYSLISSYLSCHYNRTQSINQPIAYIFKNVAILRRLMKHINKTLWQEQKKQTMTNFEKKRLSRTKRLAAHLQKLMADGVGRQLGADNWWYEKVKVFPNC